MRENLNSLHVVLVPVHEGREASPVHVRDHYGRDRPAPVDG